MKSYAKNQEKASSIEIKKEPSGVGCDEKGCIGEMMISLPVEEHYSYSRAGEPNAIKSGLKRAICGECGWRGWV